MRVGSFLKANQRTRLCLAEMWSRAPGIVPSFLPHSVHVGALTVSEITHVSEITRDLFETEQVKCGDFSLIGPDLVGLEPRGGV